MAGKTLLGIGNGGRDSARTGRDASGSQKGEGEGLNAVPTSLAGLASGPTLVDDEKVREGLRRLRSLDSSSHSRAPVDPLAPSPLAPSPLAPSPLAANVARSAEGAASESARGGTPGPARLPALPLVPSAAAARSLDDLVPISEVASGPHSSSTALVRKPETGLDRGTLVGRDLHLPPEFGGRGRAVEPSKEAARPTSKELARGRGMTPAQRPVSKQPPKLPPGVRSPLSRGSKPSGRRAVGDETIQMRGRPNLAARIVIVLATAAAVALLGVAGIRWHQDDEASNRPRPPAREWPSSETLPAPTDPFAATRSGSRRLVPGTPAAPTANQRVLPKSTSPEHATAAAEGMGSTPTVAARKLDGTSARAGSQAIADVNKADHDTAAAQPAILVDPAPESVRRHHRKEKTPEAGLGPGAGSARSPAGPAAASGTATASAGAGPASTLGNREAKPAKPRGGKDDPDSVLPLDLD